MSEGVQVEGGWTEGERGGHEGGRQRGESQERRGRRISEERVENERGEEEEKNDQKGEKGRGNVHTEKREKEKERKARWDLGKGKTDRGGVRRLWPRGTASNPIRVVLFCSLIFHFNIFPGTLKEGHTEFP